MSSIFLSHASEDNFEAVALCDWLAREGWDDVFLDLDPERGIAAGERWERALHEQANRCEAVIFLVSANWLASGWCLREYSLARAQQEAVRRRDRSRQADCRPAAGAEGHTAGDRSDRRAGRRAVADAASRHARGEARCLLQGRPQAAEAWARQGGARPEVLRRAAGRRPRARAVSRPQVARGRRRGNLLRPRRADRR